MSSTLFINCSPDTNAPDDGGSEDWSDFPVRHTQTGRWEKFCPNCEEWIGLGTNGSGYSATMHRIGKRCERTEQRKVQKKTEQGAAEELERSFGIRAPATSPTVQVASSSTTKPPPLPSHESTHTDLHLISPFATARVMHAPRLPCTGIRYKWKLGNACKTYPFQYHETGLPTWFVGIGVPSPDDDIIELQSHNCTHFRDPPMEACVSCTNVPTSREFKSVLSLASRQPPLNSPYIYLSWAQTEKRLREAKEEVRCMRRKVKWFTPNRENGHVGSDGLVHQNATLAKTLDRLEQKERATENLLALKFDPGSEMLIHPPPGDDYDDPEMVNQKNGVDL